MPNGIHREKKIFNFALIISLLKCDYGRTRKRLVVAVIYLLTQD